VQEHMVGQVVNADLGATHTTCVEVIVNNFTVFHDLNSYLKAKKGPKIVLVLVISDEIKARDLKKSYTLLAQKRAGLQTRGSGVEALPRGANFLHIE